MGDLTCVRCGENWESFGITYAKGEGDLTLDEVKKFLDGLGCPACEFGTICPRCQGGKIEKNNCSTCFGSGYVYAKRCSSAHDARFRQWFIGYSNSPTFPLRFFDTVEILRDEKPEESCEGTPALAGGARVVYVAKIKCPDCHGEGEPCTECGGDGKFHPEKQPDFFDPAVGSLLDNSDAEPVGVLMRFMCGAQANQQTAEQEGTR
jgi:hypothetical protein